MIIRTPSPALVQRILAAGEMGPLKVKYSSIGEVDERAHAIRVDGSELSEPERIRVLGLIAADDAEPFA